MKPQKTHITRDRAHYARILAENGLEEGAIRRVIEGEALGPVVEERDNSRYFRAPSPVQGDGIFALIDFAAGAEIGIAVSEGNRTLLGRYANHSQNPNSEIVPLDARNVRVRTLRSISAGAEITLDYAKGDHSRVIELLKKSML